MALNIFTLVKSVLDETYADIPGSDPAKDAAIQKACETLSSNYGNVIAAGSKVDFGDPAVRFAYLYRYVTSHANIVYELIATESVLRSLFSSETLRAVGIGGGPGSELLGILKYAAMRAAAGKALPKFKFTLFDRAYAWGESWSDVDDKIEEENVSFKTSTIFLPLDVTDPGTYEDYKKHLDSDLFLMVYFLSEVYAQRSKCGAYFDGLLSGASPGAVFVLVDNYDSRLSDWFAEACKKHGLEILKSANMVAQLPSDEEKSALAPYYPKFGSPKLQTNIHCCIARKGS